jgi:hypothetical protein
MSDLTTAILLLDRKTKHWRLQCVNDGPNRRYECQVWAAGKRFGTNRKTPLEAVKAALARIESLGTRGTLKIATVDE